MKIISSKFISHGKISTDGVSLKLYTKYDTNDEN